MLLVLLFQSEIQRLELLVYILLMLAASTLLTFGGDLCGLLVVETEDVSAGAGADAHVEAGVWSLVAD